MSKEVAWSELSLKRIALAIEFLKIDCRRAKEEAERLVRR